MSHPDQSRRCRAGAAAGEVHAKKKTLYADERGRPDVVAARKAFCVEQRTCDPSRYVFLDEFGINVDMTRRYARAPRGWRAEGSIPGRTDGNITLVFGLRNDEVIAARMFRGAMAKVDFVFYMEHILGPCLRPGDVVVTDRLPAHKASEAAAAATRAGATFELLPPYSPDLTPIENCGSKVKAALRKVAARNWDTLVDAVALALGSATPGDIEGWLIHAGFRPKRE